MFGGKQAGHVGLGATQSLWLQQQGGENKPCGKSASVRETGAGERRPIVVGFARSVREGRGKTVRQRREGPPVRRVTAETEMIWNLKGGLKLEVGWFGFFSP